MNHLELFQLKELNFKPKCEVQYKVNILTPNGEVFNEVKMNNTDDLFPHTDLTQYFDGDDSVLKHWAVDAMGYCEFIKWTSCNVVEQKQKDAGKVLSILFQEYYNKIIENITITGIKINELKGTKFISIKGIQRILGTGKEVTFITPQISLMGSLYGFEQELEMVINNIISETYEYVINKKTGNCKFNFFE